ncbi:SDR family oxidoreductase [bacterium]|nr:SDR family oxidoreductase [bacterium]
MAFNVEFLVTGASGFLGEVVTRELARRGERVVGLYRHHPIEIAGATLLSCDLSDLDQTRLLCRELRPRVVIHAAAQTNVGDAEKNPQEARRDIVQATAVLTKCLAEESPATTVVAVSTDQVYDGQPRAGDEAYRIEDPPKPLSVYGRLKLEAETHVAKLPLHSIVRTALIYGPRGTHRGSFLEWLAEGLVRGDRRELFIDEIRTPIFVEDLARALISLGKMKSCGYWLAGGLDRLSRYQMGLLVADRLGVDSSLVVPTRLSETLTPAPRPADLTLDSDSLWQEVGIERIGFEEGLDRSLARRREPR